MPSVSFDVVDENRGPARRRHRHLEPSGVALVEDITGVPPMVVVAETLRDAARRLITHDLDAMHAQRYLAVFADVLVATAPAFVAPLYVLGIAKDPHIRSTWEVSDLAAPVTMTLIELHRVSKSIACRIRLTVALLEASQAKARIEAVVIALEVFDQLGDCVQLDLVAGSCVRANTFTSYLTRHVSSPALYVRVYLVTAEAEQASDRVTACELRHQREHPAIICRTDERHVLTLALADRGHVIRNDLQELDTPIPLLVASSSTPRLLPRQFEDLLHLLIICCSLATVSVFQMTIEEPLQLPMV